MSFFSKDFKKNFKCQVGGGGQKFYFFVLGGGIKFEFWWGISSFSGGWGKEFEFDVMFGVAVKNFYSLGGGGIKFEFWWGVLIVRIGRYI